MKHIILILTLTFLIISPVYSDECKVGSASQLTNEREVGPITDLVKVKTYGKCVVTFNITVNGVTHRLQETETGMEQEESLCYYARERARKNLLLDLGGKFSTEAVTICKEGTTTIQKIKKGDHILETEVGKSKIDKYFTHNNARCRMFTERNDFKGTLAVYHGVICQIDNSNTNWLVVDKW
jgi:hypothetical protein